MEQLVLDEMTDYLVARSYPAPDGTLSPHAIERARQAFARHPACLVFEQELAHAPH